MGSARPASFNGAGMRFRAGAPGLDVRSAGMPPSLSSTGAVLLSDRCT